MKTADLLYNRSAILLSLLTVYQGREVELLHDFAEVFNELMDFSNDVTYGCTCGSPECLNKARRDFARILQREVDGVSKSPLAGVDRQVLSSSRKQRVDSFNGVVGCSVLPDFMAAYKEVLDYYVSKLDEGLF